MRRLGLVALVVGSSVACSPPAPVGTSSPELGRSHATVPPPAAPDTKPPTFRLPGDVRPLQYALELTIVPEGDKVTGRVHIDTKVVRATRVVWLNATDITVDTATLAGNAAHVVPGGDDFVGLSLDHDIQPGNLAIEVGFTAGIDRGKSRGIYSEKEGADTYAYTFFEATDARRAFPCFDEPNYKVPWQLTFHVKQGHVALANTPVVEEKNEANGMKRVVTAVTKPLPSYLVAFVVGPFEVIDGGTGGRIKTPIRFVVPKGRAGELGWAKQVTPRVVAALENYFDMDYPYGKLDVAVVPRYWGTMEHPGIVAMGQPLTLIRPEQETRSRKQHYANILAHELSHYWFGDLVTMAWWDDTWLNEALGEWSDMNITEAVEPGWRFRDSRVGLSVGAMSSDEQLSTRSIRQPVTTPEGIQASFDNDITYAKGSAVFRMIESSVGADVWRDFIRGYLRAHAWGNASAEDLFRAVKDKLGAVAETQLRSFLEQPGVPRISGEVVCTGDAPKITIHQTRALPAGVTDPKQPTWHLPVCARFGDAANAGRVCGQLDGRDGELVLAGAKCPTWFLLNADASGYYRSTVDLATAKALFTPSSPIAKLAKPTAAEKMMIVSDLRAAVDRDELQLDKLLEIVPLVAADRDEKVAVWAFEAGSFRGDALDDAMYAKALAYYAKTFAPIGRQLGWTRGKTDSDERHDLRRSFVPITAHVDRAFEKQADALADKWLATRTGIDDDMVGSVLRASARHGNQARFDKFLAAARAPRDRSEQQRLLGTLGGFTDPALAQKALDLVLGTEFDHRDSLSIIWSVAFQRETRAIGLAFLQAHIDELLARMRDDEAAGFLGGMAGAACDPDRKKLLADLIAPRAAKYNGAQNYVTRGLEQSEQCIAAFARQRPALKRFLDKQ